MLLKQLKQLKEERQPAHGAYSEVKVKGSVDKVILALKMQKASALSKLISEYEEVEKTLEQFKTRREFLNSKVKDKVSELFDAGDEVLTRIVETASITLTLSKLTKAQKQTVNYEAAIKQLVELVPEIKEQLDGLIKAHTVVETKETSPRLSAKVKEDIVVESFIDSIKSMISKTVAKVKSWTGKFDNKLAKLKQQVSNI